MSHLQSPVHLSLYLYASPWPPPPAVTSPQHTRAVPGGPTGRERDRALDMQRLASSRRLLQAAFAPRRANSSLSAAAAVAAPENGCAAPKMPHFDYTPPPYDGPRADEILQKRAEFLSPSLFHFYDRPVLFPSPHLHFNFVG
jgi:hypothetical protein